MSVIFTAVQNIPNLTGRASKAEFQYTLQSSDTEALYLQGTFNRDAGPLAPYLHLADVIVDLCHDPNMRRNH
jgi:HAE1 family hydrophobic/amphiphilic exporter-1